MPSLHFLHVIEVAETCVPNDENRSEQSMGESSINFRYCLPAASCAAIGAPIYGTVSSTNYNAGSTLSFTCNSGYFLYGPTTRTCEGGVWTGSQPQCPGRKQMNFTMIPAKNPFLKTAKLGTLIIFAPKSWRRVINLAENLKLVN